MNRSVADKLAIAPLLDELGVGFIEAGWPGAVPKDTEFFALAEKELELKNAVLAAFGSTRKVGGSAHSDPQVRALLDSGARSEEHTSELQSRGHLVCRLLLEK